MTDIRIERETCLRIRDVKFCFYLVFELAEELQTIPTVIFSPARAAAKVNRFFDEESVDVTIQ